VARALVVVDVQRGFEDPVWDRRDDVDAEEMRRATAAALQEEFAQVVTTAEVLG
jgi:nicotinamidase-related amidase